jgi:hypothetical protein
LDAKFQNAPNLEALGDDQKLLIGAARSFQQMESVRNVIHHPEAVEELENS